MMDIFDDSDNYSDEDNIPKKKSKFEITDEEDEKLPPIDIIEIFNSTSDNEVIFKWTENELKELVTDYVHFIVFKAAFSDIESNPGPHNKLLKSFKLLNTEINSMCNFMITHIDLHEDLVGAVRRHSQRVVSYKYTNELCTVCQGRPAHRLQYLGPNYHKNDLKIEKTVFPPQTLLLCNLHTYFADTFFSLVHMKWNIHLNIEHRIKQQNIPSRGNKAINEDIGIDVITNLAAYYFHIISRLKSTDPTIFMNPNFVTPKQGYVSVVKNYVQHTRLYGEASQLLPGLNSARLDTLVLNRGYRLPNITYSCLSIDTTENRFLLAGASNGDIYVADLLQVIEQKQEAVGFYRRGQLSGEDHSVKLWDTENLAVIDTYKFETDTESISGLDWNSFEPHLLAVGLSSSVVKFVDPSVGSVVQQIRWSSNHITSLKWYPQNAFMIFTGTKEGNAGIFDIRHSKRPLCEFDENTGKTGHRSEYTKAKFTADGTKLITLNSNGRIKVFRMSDGEMINEIHNFRTRIKKGASFDLCNEGNTVMAFVPSSTEINMISIEPTYYVIDDERKRVPTPSRKLYSGFASDAVACLYRPKFQHVRFKKFVSNFILFFT
uniref:Anaphase-promoting complex subunit 4-like WD40 domain-containing protein n=1 Tax=Panagrolaimus sp. ES5 TaxID=591445 RepID=A0AC34F3N4_9BILA